MTAENSGDPGANRGQDHRFNEAAADDRGKPCGRGTTCRPLRRASMRPRPMTAENWFCPLFLLEQNQTLQ